MADITSIGALLGNLKAAKDIAQLIKGADFSLEKTETKLQFAALMKALAESKIVVSEIWETLQQKDEEIKRLEEALALKVKLVRHLDAYYEITPDGKAFGDPFCSYCWEVSHKVIHISKPFARSPSTVCPLCRSAYDRNLTPVIPKTRV
jgi:hypothetical protein